MRRMPSARHQTWWMLALALLGAGLLFPSAAHAETAPADDTDFTPGTGTLVYEGTSVRDSFSIDGDDENSVTDPVTLTVTCVDFECTIAGLPFWARFVETASAQLGQLSASWSEPASGTPCAEFGDADYYINASEGTATVTPASFTATALEQPSEWFSCSSTSSSTRWGANLVLEAELVSGDACVLDVDACPEPAVAPAPLAAASTPSTPGVLSGLATPDDTLAPQQLLSAIALTIVLVVLLALPTALLNSASSTGAERLAEWRAQLAVRSAAMGTNIPAQVRALGARLRIGWSRASAAGRGLPLAAATLLCAAVVSGFVDPDFGLGASTPRVLLSIVLGFTIEVLLGWIALLVLLPRHISGVDARLDARPATLLIVIGAVIVTRLTGFEPGIVFGLVAGVAVGATLATAIRVRVALVSLGWGYMLALLAWVAYAALDPVVATSAAASADGLPPLGLVLLTETLATMTVAGIAALPVALVPARGLTGHELWQWSKVWWAALYGLGLVSFFLVLMPMPFAWAGVEAALATWVGGYLAYAAAAVALWLVITQPWKKDAAADDAAMASTTQD